MSKPMFPYPPQPTVVHGEHEWYWNGSSVLFPVPPASKMIPLEGSAVHAALKAKAASMGVRWDH